MSLVEKSKQLANFKLEDFAAASDELVRANIARFKKVILRQLYNHVVSNGSAIVESSNPDFKSIIKTVVEDLFVSATKSIFNDDIMTLSAYGEHDEVLGEFYFMQDDYDNIFQVFVEIDDNSNPIRDYAGRLRLDTSQQATEINQDGSAEYEILSLGFKIAKHIKNMIVGEEATVVPLTQLSIDYEKGKLTVEKYDIHKTDDMLRLIRIVENSGFKSEKNHPILGILGLDQ